MIQGLYPALRRATILVELHEYLVPGIEDQLRMRFASTHRMTHILQESPRPRGVSVAHLGTTLLPNSYIGLGFERMAPAAKGWLWMLL